MISQHDDEIIGEIVDHNAVRVVAAAYTIYEQMCTKKTISKREFYKEFEDNLAHFGKYSMKKIEITNKMIDLFSL